MYYIVWNKDKTEGFVTNDKSDARYTATGHTVKFGVPSVGEAFRDAYDNGDHLEIQEVDLQPNTTDDRR
jgi:hypothetical protein